MSLTLTKGHFELQEHGNPVALQKYMDSGIEGLILTTEDGRQRASP